MSAGYLNLDLPDPDTVYEHYPVTYKMLGVEPVSRDRALGLIGEWTEALSGRTDPTTH